MIRATTQQLDNLVNHTDLAPAFGIPPDMHAYMGKFYDEPGNVALLTDEGAMMFGRTSLGEYEVHFAFLPEYSGKQVKATARSMLREMFTRYGATVIRGQPPRSNRAVRHMGAALGFSKVADSKFTDTLGRVCDVYEMRRLDG